LNLRTRIAAAAMSASMVGLGVSSPAEAATSDPLRVTGNLGGRAFAGQLFDLSLSRPAGATSATLTGTLKGAGLPAAGMRFTATAHVEVSAVDPITYAAVAVVLAGAAALASYLPARRATSVDPLEALRAE